jgi:hypothetical protein
MAITESVRFTNSCSVKFAYLLVEGIGHMPVRNQCCRFRPRQRSAFPVRVKRSLFPGTQSIKALLPVQSDGSLGPASDVVKHSGAPGPNSRRQEASHAHMILPDPSGKFALSPDLGLDCVFVYRLDHSTRKLVATSSPLEFAHYDARCSSTRRQPGVPRSHENRPPVMDHRDLVMFERR